jgi:glycosyltransferase involved in cell wall biosynthesis
VPISANSSAPSTAAAGGSAPAVSIGIPVRDGGRFIADAIEAALAQSVTDLEVVISDNGSSDDTERICRAFAARDARVRYDRSEGNIGAARNFDRVLQLARGRYFAWLPADDLMAPAFVERTVALLERTPGAVGACTLGAFVDGGGRHLHHFAEFLPAGGWPADPRMRVATFLDWAYRDGRTAMIAVLGLWHAETLRSVRPLGSYYGSDWVLCAELATRGSIELVSEPLATYRRHEGSSSSTARALTSRVQQRFFNPHSQGALATWWNRRQRHAELVVAIARSPLPLPTRTRLIVGLARHSLVVGAWRARRIAARLSPRRHPRPIEDASELL